MSLTLTQPRVTTVGDFFALLKPRVMSLVVFTGLAGIVAAPGQLHPLTAFTALLCIAVAAGASGCLNMAYDSDIDGLMTRTAKRPIPMGYVAREDALAFGWTLSAAAVATMGLFVNFLAAGLLVAAGLLREIDLGDEQTTYDPNFLDKPAHNHLVCIDCGRVVEFEDAQLENLTACMTRRLGFEPIRQSLKIEATCEQLRNQGRCANLIAARLSGKRLRKKR